MYIKEIQYKHIMSDEMPVRPPVVPIREALKDLYLDWVNNYVSLEKMGSDYGIEALILLKLVNQGREIYEQSL